MSEHNFGSGMCEKCWQQAATLYADGQGTFESQTEAYNFVLDKHAREHLAATQPEPSVPGERRKCWCGGVDGYCDAAECAARSEERAPPEPDGVLRELSDIVERLDGVSEATMYPIDNQQAFHEALAHIRQARDRLRALTTTGSREI